jgi:hypothetical protein
MNSRTRKTSQQFTALNLPHTEAVSREDVPKSGSETRGLISKFQGAGIVCSLHFEPDLTNTVTRSE